jgi:hypothetical protein
LPKELHKLYFEEIKVCDRCHRCPEIGKLAKEDLSVTRRFMLHWLPCKRGEPPFRYVFLALEPSFTAIREGEEYPQEGGFHGGLRFAIRRFLFQKEDEESYLITNVGKCTIAGKLAKKTRWFRWEKCSSYLVKECNAVEALSGSVVYIAVGRDPIRFIASHQNLYSGFFTHRKIHRLLHYSPQNDRRFRKFAMEHESEYQEFSDQAATALENFLRGEEAGKDLQRFQDDRNRELSRVFMWSYQMREILQN